MSRADDTIEGTAEPMPYHGNGAPRRDDRGESPERPASLSLLKDIVLPVAVAVAGTFSFLGLIGIIGAALSWLRFRMAGLPADQAINVMPTGERIVAGTNALLYFLVSAVLLIAVISAIPWARLSALQGRGRRLTTDQVRSFGTSVLLFLAGVMATVVLVMSSTHYDLATNSVLLLLTVAIVLPIFARWKSLHLSPHSRQHGRIWTRLGLTKWDAIGIATVFAIPMGLYLVSDHREDLVVAIAAASVLSLLAYGITEAAATRFGRQGTTDATAESDAPGPMWPIALAVLLVVPLYGATWRAAEFSHEPQVAPVALIRDVSDPHGHAYHQVVSGIYVATTNDRMWVAGVALVCNDDGTPSDTRIPNTGRLISFPTSGIGEYTIGPVGSLSEAMNAGPSLTAQLRLLHGVKGSRTADPLVKCRKQPKASG